MSNKKKWYSGESPRDREQHAKSTVINLLSANGTELQWSKLKEKAESSGISSTTLSKHLKEAVRLGTVSRRVDASTYPPRVLYSRRDQYLFPTKFNEQDRLLRELSLVEEILAGARKGPGTPGLYEQTLNVNLAFMKASLPTFLYARLGGKGPYEFKPGELSQEGAVDRYLEQARKDAHDLADELLDVVLRPWIHKLLDFLLLFSSSNKGVLEEAARPILEEGIKALKRYDELLMPYRKG
jgi:hypothetical protein